jgi:hypothetical protein
MVLVSAGTVLHRGGRGGPVGAYLGPARIGGAFTRLAGAEAHGLAALDPATGRPVSTWHPEPGSEITALTASRGRILIGADS